MRHFIVIILVNALVAMPLLATGFSDQCCCAGEESTTQSINEVPTIESCCLSSGVSDQSESSEDTLPAKPCNSDDCPSTCCLNVVCSAYVLPGTNGMQQSNIAPSAVLPRAELNMGQPHLLRLKRPPRAV